MSTVKALQIVQRSLTDHWGIELTKPYKPALQAKGLGVRLTASHQDPLRGNFTWGKIHLL